MSCFLACISSRPLVQGCLVVTGSLPVISIGILPLLWCLLIRLAMLGQLAIQNHLLLSNSLKTEQMEEMPAHKECKS